LEEDKNFCARTDLAVEAHEILKEDKINGIEIFEQDLKDIFITKVNIKEQSAAEKLNKSIGSYITIDCVNLRDNIVEYRERVIKILAENISQLVDNRKFENTLIVGLGNWNVTPDALGPKVVSKVLVTRHIKNILPEELKNSVRAVSAISPGVLGLTGLETFEIIKGLCEKTKPDLIILVDALAARNASRINSTIQVSNTGITPGMGMGNKRVALDKSSLETEIISLGVPTVIDAATLVNDTMDKILSTMESAVKNSEHARDFYAMLNELDTHEKYNLIKQILDPYEQNMFVTPKEVDEVIERLSNIISNAINIFLHDEITLRDINRFINS